MKTTKMYELSKDDIRATIFNYIGEQYGRIDDFEIIVDDYEKTMKINMNEGIRASDIKCHITVCETR